MATKGWENVEAYLAAQPPDVREVLEAVRKVIRKAAPRAEEVISYQIPAYKLDGRILIFFAGWKKHFSLYPATEGLRRQFRKELENVDINDRGTLRFPLEERIPAQLIAKLVKFRAGEVAEAAETRAAAKKKTPARPSPKKKAAATAKKAPPKRKPAAKKKAK